MASDGELAGGRAPGSSPWRTSTRGMSVSASPPAATATICNLSIAPARPADRAAGAARRSRLHHRERVPARSRLPRPGMGCDPRAGSRSETLRRMHAPSRRSPKIRSNGR
ncbi:MAG: hypothetical protein MZV70_67815 [Desulfobacterales bacterium]|nr:hypothetical protein [Desulfobacterales bacterium]